MTLPASGNSLSLNEIHVFVGGTSGSTVSLNDSDVRDIVGIADGGTQSLNSYFGAKLPFTATMTVGEAFVFTPGTQYTSSSKEFSRGYNDGTQSNQGAGGGEPGGTGRENPLYGSMTSYQNSNYLNNNTIKHLGCTAVNNTSPGVPITGNNFISLNVSNTNGSAHNINSNSSFKKITIGTEIFNRSDANYSDGGATGNTSVSASHRTLWSWSFSTTLPPTRTDAIPPFSAPGQTQDIKIHG